MSFGGDPVKAEIAIERNRGKLGKPGGLIDMDEFYMGVEIGVWVNRNTYTTISWIPGEIAKTWGYC